MFSFYNVHFFIIIYRVPHNTHTCINAHVCYVFPSMHIYMHIYVPLCVCVSVFPCMHIYMHKYAPVYVLLCYILCGIWLVCTYIHILPYMHSQPHAMTIDFN